MIYDMIYDTTHYWTAWNDILKHLSIDVVHIIFFFFYWNSSLNVIFFLLEHHPDMMPPTIEPRDMIYWNISLWYTMIYDIRQSLYGSSYIV